ncbi:MAG TPA: alpha/beta hydrolase [Clostridia bacterium]|nr:alpha/beta hydrolase [Clostridia bacterium]
MSQESFTFTGVNGQKVFVHSWSADVTPRCILLIIHGMAEHGGRYSDFAGFLNEKGISVYAPDMRGHGETGELNGNLCHLEYGGFNGIVEDHAKLARLLGEKHAGIPLFILGHSFGSFIGQEFIKRYGKEISGAILTGSNFMKDPLFQFGRIVAFLSMAFGSRRPNRLIDFMGFKPYNKRITNPVSKFTWLTRDESIVRSYDNDRYCGIVMSTGFYYCFFKGLNSLYGGKPGIPAKLPVAIFSGSDDPVGKYGEGPKKLYEWYRSIGLEDLSLKLYEGARHEILNETNKAEVYLDISAWLYKHLG